MSSNLVDNPKLFRHVLEDLPVGIYVVDRELRIRFWNHGAEQLTGHLAHEVVGHILEEVVQSCNRRGNSLSGEHCPVTMTLNQRKAQRCTASYLHKNGHRSAVTIRTRPIPEAGDAITGAAILFEEAFVYREESLGPPMYGCLDAITGIPSQRLTRAVLKECMAGVEESHLGFGMLRIRVLGMEEFCSKHGPQSAVPFLRTALLFGPSTLWPTMPAADSRPTLRMNRSILRHDAVTWGGSPEENSTAFDAQPPDLPPVCLVEVGFAVV